MHWRSPWRRGAALAVSTRPAVRRGKGIAPALGTGPMVVHADGDGKGRDAALATAKAVRSADRECRIEWYAGDPADALSEWIVERAAIREFEGGEARDDADRGAWHDLMRGIER